MTNPEMMAEFFNKRAETYDKDMRENVSDYKEFYTSISNCITGTQDTINVLDIGIGTGLELKWIFERAPDAIITGIDVSKDMLDKLKGKYADHLGQITLIQSSYLTFPFDEAKFDYIVSVMSVHHLLPDAKQELYEKVRKALKNTGRYVEGDYIVSPEEEAISLSKYKEWIKSNKKIENGSHHIDVPLSIETQRHLMTRAGFSKIEVIRQGSKDAVYWACP